MGSFQVIKSGFQSTIQDLGRLGYRKIGVPTSGAMDVKSMRDANMIVGNPKSSAVIEHTFYGGTYRFKDSAKISITGASCNPMINGNEISQYELIKIEKGDQLEIHYPSRGCRSYLAVQGYLSIQKVMESYSTYLPGKFGGYKGRSLQEGDELTWIDIQNQSDPLAFRKEELPYFSSRISVTIEKGPEFTELGQSTVDRLFSQSFSVESQSNRMGIRLIGEKLETQRIQMVSSPVIPGIIQLPPSGDLIILMKDGQTIGGYPRIGLVRESELWRLGQVKPGDQITFKLA